VACAENDRKSARSAAKLVRPCLIMDSCVRRWSRAVARAGVLAAVAMMLGCMGFPPPADLGRQGRLAFAYREGGLWSVPSMSSRLASGARVGVRVGVPKPGAVGKHAGQNDATGPRWRYEVADLDPVKILAAESLDTNVLRVIGTEEAGAANGGLSSIALEGVAPGSCEVRVRSTLGTDTIAMVVARVARVRVTNPMSAFWPIPDWSFALLAGGRTQLWTEMLDENGGELTGVDFPHLVTAEGGPPVRLQQKGRILHVTPDAPGQVLLRPYGSTPALVLPVVAPSEVVAIALAVCLEEKHRCTKEPHLEVGDDPQPVFIEARLADGRMALGVEGLGRVDSETPDVCTTARLGDNMFRGDVMGVSAIKPGVCRIVGTLGERRVTTQWSVSRRSPPTSPPDSPGTASSKTQPE
jgi:hypothetical protein